MFSASLFFFFFNQKTAYEMRISDWSSDVCSSDLYFALPPVEIVQQVALLTEPALRLDLGAKPRCAGSGIALESGDRGVLILDHAGDGAERTVGDVPCDGAAELPRRYAPRLATGRSEEHTSELQSLMRISYAVFCLKN